VVFIRVDGKYLAVGVHRRYRRCIQVPTRRRRAGYTPSRLHFTPHHSGTGTLQITVTVTVKPSFPPFDSCAHPRLQLYLKAGTLKKKSVEGPHRPIRVSLTRREALILCSARGPQARRLDYHSGHSSEKRLCDMRLPYTTVLICRPDVDACRVVPLGTIGQNLGLQ
jgi:hypothetical protein